MKNIKKALCLLLVAVMIFGFIPVQTQAKTSIKLSAKKITIEKDSWSYLYVTGYFKTVKWYTSNKKIAIVKNGMVTAKSEGKCKITAKCGTKKLVCKVTVTYPDDKKAKDLKEYSYDVYKEVFELYKYCKYGNELGTVNPEYEKKKLDNLMADLGKMVTIANSIKGSDWATFKETFELFATEAQAQYQNVNSTDFSIMPSENVIINDDLLSRYKTDLSNIYYDLT